MKNFPTFTLDYVRKRLTTAQGWAYYAWARENEATMLGAGLDRKSSGYVRQERERLERERHG